MTEVKIHKTKSGEYLKFTCDGHAGYANYGKDIVCAAISILVINTVNSLGEITKEAVQVETDEEAGRISCTFLRQPLKETSVALMDSLILGLSQIEAQYGKQHCKLTFEEV